MNSFRLGQGRVCLGGWQASITRRHVLRTGALGMFGGAHALFLPQKGTAAKPYRSNGFGNARSCIVLFCWGGMSQLESWDPKPDAPKQVRGPYKPISTSTPGVQIGELMPNLAKQTNRLAIVRSVRHRARDHRQAAYWTLTGVPPLVLDGAMVSKPVLPSRQDKPCLGSMVAAAGRTRPGLPAAVTLPYPIAERGLAAGQNGGFLGVRFDPVFFRPNSGKPFPGVSPMSTTVNTDLWNARSAHLRDRRVLLESVGDRLASQVSGSPVGSYDYFRRLALDLVTDSRIRAAFDLEKEHQSVRDAYGDHIFGQSVLLARRLIEIGMPLVTVNCGAGDLNGGVGAIWDTHFQNFTQLKNHLMPPFDLAASALLTDLTNRGMLEDTLVVLLTEFGRQPLINQFAGRDHLPDCYSVAFAGGGIRGGQIHGRSNRYANEVEEGACGPADLHATVLHAMGVDPQFKIDDAEGNAIPLSEGSPLPLFDRTHS